MEKSQKKWSLGNILFRKNKKQIPQADFSSEEDDLKAGFNDDFVKKVPLRGKTNKQFVQKYGHQESVPDLDFHYFKPSVGHQEQLINRSPNIYSNQSNIDYVNNHLNIEKNRIPQPRNIYNNDVNQYQGSSQDEKSSYNSLSSPLNKAGSESGSRTSLNKRTRNARNERYYQRIMRDDGRPLTIYGNVSATESSHYRPPLNSANNRLSASMKSGSLCSSDFMLPLNQSQSLPVPRHRYHSDYDKDDYENILEVDESVPPPIPPRDPNRRFSINASISQQPYYFDQALQKYVIFNTANGRCFSEDRLNRNEREISQTRLINSTKADENATKQHDILKPRSRKPINLNTNLDNESIMNTGDVVDNAQHSVSQNKRSSSAIDFVKLRHDPVGTKFSVRQRNLTSVEPIKFNLAQDIYNNNHSINNETLRKKYSSAEDVNINKARKPAANVIAPNARKSLNVMDLKAKSNVSSNLDDAITELELMYKSLVKSEVDIDRVEKRDRLTPTKFALMMKKYDEYENEENTNDKEPDIVRDDVFSRNLKYANQKLKSSEPLPFGIPNPKLCPTTLKPSHDYLSIEPIQMRKSMIAVQDNPDVIADDLAVRNLRKDTPNYGRRRNLIELDNNQFVKRNQTLSAVTDQIHNEILKNSAKPSGGRDLADYLQLDPIKRSEPKKERDADFEDSLNALVAQSKAIKQKLDKDLSNLKRETPRSPNSRKTLVNLLDYRNVIEKEKEKKTSTSNENLAKTARESDIPKVTMTSTACSPIKHLENLLPLKDVIKRPTQIVNENQAQKQIQSPVQKYVQSSTAKIQSPTPKQVQSPIPKQRHVQVSTPKTTTSQTQHLTLSPIQSPAKSPIPKAEKIGSLIKMFNQTPPADQKKASKSPPVEKVSKNVSNLQGLLHKEKIFEKSSTPTVTSPTKMSFRVTSPKAPPQVEVRNVRVEVKNTATEVKNAPIDVESNINNIKQLIEQIKQTDLKGNHKTGSIPLIAKSGDNDLPDYDNIKDDYEMTDGRLERITESSLKVGSPKASRAPIAIEERNSEVMPTSSSSSCFRETSVESSSKESAKSDHYDEATAMYEDAMRFTKESAKATKPNTVSQPKADQPKTVVATVTYVEHRTVNPEPVRHHDHKKESEELPVLKGKLLIEVKSHETPQANSPEPKLPSPIVKIMPIIPPDLIPVDNDSLYNSTEELSMIFGNGKQLTPDVPIQAGKSVDEDFEAQFEQIVHDNEIADDKVLEENFQVSLIDVNTSAIETSYNECFNNEFSEVSTERAMSTEERNLEIEASKSDSNNNLPTSDLSKLTDDHSSSIVNRRLKPSSYNSPQPDSSCSVTNSNINPPAALKKQNIFLAFIYCLMLYLQFLALNFKSS